MLEGALQTIAGVAVLLALMWMAWRLRRTLEPGASALKHRNGFIRATATPADVLDVIDRFLPTGRTGASATYRVSGLGALTVQRARAGFVARWDGTESAPARALRAGGGAGVTTQTPQMLELQTGEDYLGFRDVVSDVVEAIGAEPGQKHLAWTC